MKKESEKRSYMTKTELNAHLKKLRGDTDKIVYLSSLLNDRASFEPMERLVIFEALKTLDKSQLNSYREEYKLLKSAFKDREMACRYGANSRANRLQANINERYGENLMDLHIASSSDSDMADGYISAALEKERLATKLIQFQKEGRTPSKSDLSLFLSPVRPSTWAVIAIAGLGVGAFFLSSKVTGNVIGMSTQTSSLISVGLLAISLISGFLWLKNKRK